MAGLRSEMRVGWDGWSTLVVPASLLCEWKRFGPVHWRSEEESSALTVWFLESTVFTGPRLMKRDEELVQWCAFLFMFTAQCYGFEHFYSYFSSLVTLRWVLFFSPVWHYMIWLFPQIKICWLCDNLLCLLEILCVYSWREKIEFPCCLEAAVPVFYHRVEQLSRFDPLIPIVALKNAITLTGNDVTLIQTQDRQSWF